MILKSLKFMLNKRKMKRIKTLLLFLTLSTMSLSQTTQSSQIETNNTSIFVAEEIQELTALLDLNEDQVFEITNILNGISQKNIQVSSMNLIQEDKDEILERNNNAKTNMIIGQLNEAQKAIYLDSLN
jgi:competence protein ComGF